MVKISIITKLILYEYSPYPNLFILLSHLSILPPISWIDDFRAGWIDGDKNIGDRFTRAGHGIEPADDLGVHDTHARQGLYNRVVLNLLPNKIDCCITGQSLPNINRLGDWDTYVQWSGQSVFSRLHPGLEMRDLLVLSEGLFAGVELQRQSPAQSIQRWSLVFRISMCKNPCAALEAGPEIYRSFRKKTGLDADRPNALLKHRSGSLKTP